MTGDTQPRVVIVGGGFGGVFAARRLHQLARGRIAIELISRNNFFVFQPLLPEVAGGGVHPADAVVPLRLFLPGVRVRVAEVRKIDFAAKTVHVSVAHAAGIVQVEYDQLVIALGQTVDLSRTPGLADRALPMKDIADAFRTRNQILACLEEAAATSDARRQQRLLTFVVIGGGFTGVEAVGEIQELIGKSLRFYPRLRASDVRIVLVQHGERILPELPAHLAAYADRKLRQRGIEILLKTGVKAATLDGIETDGGQRIDAETIIAAIGNAPSPLVKSLPLTLDHGQIVVDPCLRVTGVDGVWAIGDNARIPLGEPSASDGKAASAPPLAQFAYREAKHLAANILASLDGRTLLPFHYRAIGTMASLGSRSGVAEVMGVRISGFLAWALWRLFYLAMVPGFANRVRIATDWLLELVVRRSIAEIRPVHTPSGPVRFFAGDLVVEPGVEPAGLYIIETGAFVVDTPDDPGTPSRRIGPGGWFGAPLAGQTPPENARICATEDSTVYFIDRDDLQRVAAVQALVAGRGNAASAAS